MLFLPPQTTKYCATLKLGAASLRLLGVVQWWIHNYEILLYLG